MTQSEMEQQTTSTQPEEPELDQAMLDVAFEKLRSEQNLAGGVIAGLVAALAGAAIWAVVTVLTGYQIGWMAVGVGFLVAMAVRIVGKGIDKSFAIAGAVLALFGCLLGNLFTVCHFVASTEQMGFFDVLSRLNPTVTFELMKATASPMDIVFYAIAVYEGFKLSCRQITREELVAAVKGSAAQHESAGLQA